MNRWVALFIASLIVASRVFADDENIPKMRYKKEHALDRVTKKFEAAIPSEARLPDGSPDINHPAYQQVKAQWQEQMDRTRAHYDQKDTRESMFETARRDAGLRGEVVLDEKGVPKEVGALVGDTGGKAKSLGSDKDYTAADYPSGKRYVEQLKRQQPGIRVAEDSRGWRLPDKDVLVWNTSRGKEPPGSSSYEAMIRDQAQPHKDTFPHPGGMHSTSGGRLGHEDARGAVLSNAVKAKDAGINGKPADMHVQMVAKSVHKSMEAAGTKDLNPEFVGQLEKLRAHRRPEEAGIVTFGATPERKLQERARFQEKAQEEMRVAYEKAGQLSRELDSQRSRKVQELLAAGNKRGAAKVRDTQIEIEVATDVVLQEMARDNPRFVKKLTGLDPESVPGRERMIGPSAKLTKISSDHQKAPDGVEPSAALPVAPESSPRQLLNKWGGRTMTGLDILSGGIGAAQEEIEEAIREGRSPSKVRAATRAVKDTLWGLTGIPAVQQTVQRGRELVKEELDAADARHGAEGHSGTVATLKATGRFAKEVMQWDTASQMAREEMAHEEEQARLDGREPNYLRSSVNGLARTVGNVIGIEKIAEFASTDWPAKAEAARDERFQRYWANARASEGLEQVKAIQDELNDALNNLDPYNPAHRARLDGLLARYEKARGTLLTVSQFMRKQFGPEDEGAAALYDAVGQLPNPAGVTAVLAAYDRVKAEMDAEAPQLVDEPDERETGGDEWAAVGDVETVAGTQEQPVAEPRWEDIPPEPPVAPEVTGGGSGFDPATSGIIGGAVEILNRAAGGRERAAIGEPAGGEESGWGHAPAARDCSTNYYFNSGGGGRICNCAGYRWDTRRNACVEGAATGGGVVPGFGPGSPTNAQPWPPEPAPAPAAAPPAPVPPRRTVDDPCQWRVVEHGPCTYDSDSLRRALQRCGRCLCPYGGHCDGL